MASSVVFVFFAYFFLPTSNRFGATVATSRHCALFRVGTEFCTGFFTEFFFPYFVRRFEKQISRLEKNSEVKLFLLESKKKREKRKIWNFYFFLPVDLETRCNWRSGVKGSRHVCSKNAVSVAMATQRQFFPARFTAKNPVKPGTTPKPHPPKPALPFRVVFFFYAVRF